MNHLYTKEEKLTNFSMKFLIVLRKLDKTICSTNNVQIFKKSTFYISCYFIENFLYKRRNLLWLWISLFIPIMGYGFGELEGKSWNKFKKNKQDALKTNGFGGGLLLLYTETFSRKMAKSPCWIIEFKLSVDYTFQLNFMKLASFPST